MTKKFIAGGCSFTYGSELSDDNQGKKPSEKSWAYRLKSSTLDEYVCTAKPGAGNSGIARRVFTAVANAEEISGVVVMWSFNSRYDWAMPRHRELEGTRWATISPWDTSMSSDERHQALSGSEGQQEEWKRRVGLMVETGVKPFAEAIYRYHSCSHWQTTVYSTRNLNSTRIRIH